MPRLRFNLNQGQPGRSTINTTPVGNGFSELGQGLRQAGAQAISAGRRMNKVVKATEDKLASQDLVINTREKLLEIDETMRFSSALPSEARASALEASTKVKDEAMKIARDGGFPNSFATGIGSTMANHQKTISGEFLKKTIEYTSGTLSLQQGKVLERFSEDIHVTKSDKPGEPGFFSSAATYRLNPESLEAVQGSMRQHMDALLDSANILGSDEAAKRVTQFNEQLNSEVIRSIALNNASDVLSDGSTVIKIVDVQMDEEGQLVFGERNLTVDETLELRSTASAFLEQERAEEASQFKQREREQAVVAADFDVAVQDEMMISSETGNVVNVQALVEEFESNKAGMSAKGRAASQRMISNIKKSQTQADFVRERGVLAMRVGIAEGLITTNEEIYENQQGNYGSDMMKTLMGELNLHRADLEKTSEKHFKEATGFIDGFVGKLNPKTFTMDPNGSKTMMVLKLNMRTEWNKLSDKERTRNNALAIMGEQMLPVLPEIRRELNIDNNFQAQVEKMIGVRNPKDLTDQDILNLKNTQNWSAEQTTLNLIYFRMIKMSSILRENDKGGFVENQFDKETQDVLIKPFSSRALQMATGISEQLVLDAEIRAETVKNLPAPTLDTATIPEQAVKKVKADIARKEAKKAEILKPVVKAAKSIQEKTQAIMNSFRQ